MVGCGVVGTGVVQLLHENGASITRRLGAPLKLSAIAVGDRTKTRDPIVPTDRFVTADELLRRTDIDIVVEVMGGATRAGDLVRRALEQKKHVVTANKALIAEQGDSLLQLAEQQRVDLYFEAAVAGGIPIIRVLREGLSSDRIVALKGIVNGTSNYILSQMTSAGISFEEALQQAQRAGYAEADPSLDIGGGDAAHKLAILGTLAYGARLHPSRVSTEGIASIEADDIRFADRFGFVIKPLAVVTPAGEQLSARVHPALVSRSDVLASIHDALNAVFVEGAMLGPCLLSGPGAGALPTAMSVVSDIVDVARNLLVGAHGRVPSRALRGDSLKEITVQPIEEHRCRFFLRFRAHDRSGVMGRLAGALGSCGVSIEQMVQEARPQHTGTATSHTAHSHTAHSQSGHSGSVEATPVTVVILTHEASEKSVRDALAEIARLHDTVESAVALRIED